MGIKHTYSGEDQKFDVLDAGTYPATIIEAIEKVSKNGNDMIEIVFEVEGGHRIYDYLVFTEKTAFKVDAFLSATGKAPEKGKEVEIVADELVGVELSIEVEVEPASGPYDAKNKVVRYVSSKVAPSSAAKAGKKESDPF